MLQMFDYQFYLPNFLKFCDNIAHTLLGSWQFLKFWNGPLCRNKIQPLPHYSMLQHIGRVTTLKLVQRNCRGYLQTTLIIGRGGLISEFMWGILGSKFQLQQRIFIFSNKFAIKRMLSFKERTSKHHHWILRIWGKLSTKFKLKLTIFIF